MKKISKVLALALSAVLAVGCLSGCSSQQTQTGTSDSGEKKLNVAFILSGSISDGSFGTVSYQGIQEVQKEDYIEKADYMEGIDAATDAAKAIRDYVADGYDVIWGQSGSHGSTIMEIAPEFPDSTFVTLVAPPADKTFDNVWFSLNECEGAYYVAGALAAMKSESHIIGYVGGRENPLYVACEKAYEEGAQSVDPSVKVLSAFTGDFNDPIKAKEATTSQIENGADVIIHIQSLGVSGVFAAAEDAKKSGKQVWIIGKDTDQYEQAPDVILTSVVFDYGAQMKNILKEIADGKRSGSMAQSLANGGVYLADYRGSVSEDIQQKIDELTQKVINGEVTYTTQYDIS